MKRSNFSVFTFENIVFLSDRDLLLLLKQIDNVTLLKACKQCDEFIVQRIICQFTEAGRQYFLVDSQNLGPTTDDEILAAQNKIGEILSRLYLKGRLKDWTSKYAA